MFARNGLDMYELVKRFIMKGLATWKSYRIFDPSTLPTTLVSAFRGTRVIVNMTHGWVVDLA